MVDLWAKLELDVIEVAGAGFRGCFVVGAIERENAVLKLFI